MRLDVPSEEQFRGACRESSIYLVQNSSKSVTVSFREHHRREDEYRTRPTAPTAVACLVDVNAIGRAWHSDTLTTQATPFSASCKHTFVTAEAHAHVRFRRAIECRALWAAEDAARELPNLPLEDALRLVHRYAERGSPKYERAAMRWLERYLAEGAPRLQYFTKVVENLARRDPEG